MSISELDARIARDIMGWTEVEKGAYPSVTDDEWMGRRPARSGHFLEYVPEYSGNISDAWLIVRRLTSEPLCMTLTLFNEGPAEWKAVFRQTREMYWYSGHSVAETPALAICLAVTDVWERNEWFRKMIETLNSSRTSDKPCS